MMGKQGVFISDYYGGYMDSVVSGSANDDTIALHNSKWMTIEGGNGSDSIMAFEGTRNVKINGGSGDDVIEAWGQFITIHGGTGEDTIRLYSNSVYADSGSGNDVLVVNGEFDYSSGMYVSSGMKLYAGDGDDTIKFDFEVSNMTVSGGQGKDMFRLSNEYSSSFAITDFSNEDWIRNDQAEDLSISYSMENGNVVLERSGQFRIIMLGVTDIYQIADAKYRTLAGEGTLRELLSLPDPDPKEGLEFNEDQTEVYVLDDYPGNSFSASDYENLKIIDASDFSRSIQIVGNPLSNTVKGGSSKDTLMGGAGNDKLYGNAGNDKLYGEKGNDLLSGGAGNDTISGGKGTDTLTGGSGNDVFLYANGDGKDIITDYTAGKDKIRISTGAVAKGTVSGNHVVLAVGNGSLTVKNGVKKRIDVVNSAGNSISYYYGSTASSNKLTGSSNASRIVGGSKNDTLTAGTGSATIEGGSGKDVVKGGSKNDWLYGGAGNDKLYGNAGSDKLYGETGNDLLSGGAGNDTISGGKGVDTLTGGSGNDVFLYANGDGKDIITDYTAGKDKIRISSGTIKNAVVKKSDVVLTVGSGTITVKGARGKKITIVDVAGKKTSTTAFSSGTYIYSKGKFKASARDTMQAVESSASSPWFLDTENQNYVDNDYATADFIAKTPDTASRTAMESAFLVRDVGTLMGDTREDNIITGNVTRNKGMMANKL